MKIKEDNNVEVKGWGVDADPDNEPTYPIKNYTGDDHKRLDYEKPQAQGTDIEVFHSNERPALTAVYGTSVPPSGISGAVRRFAFKYSENSYKHWLSLLLADRINVLEGIFDDLKHARIPNLFAERGFKSAWKFNRKNVIKKAAIYTIVAAGAAAFIIKKRR